MPKPNLSVLVYNCSGPQWSKLHQILMLLRMRIRVITPALYHIPLMELAKGKWDKEQELQEPGEPFDEPMIVFCGLGQMQLKPILNALFLAKVPNIPLKAILTTTNAQWDSKQLHEELCREREAIRAKAEAYYKEQAQEKEQAQKGEESKPAQTEGADAQPQEQPQTESQDAKAQENAN